MTQPMHPSASAQAREAATDKEELVTRIVTLLERTFAPNGQPRAVETLTAQFLTMDDLALRQMALSMGLDEPGEPEPEEG
jgi:hypothetical protein